MNLFKKTILLSYISIASTEAVMLTPAFPLIQKTFSATSAAVSSLMTFFLLGYLLSQLLFGPVANRLGRLVCMRAGFLLNIGGVLFALLATATCHLDVLIAARFVMALGAGVGLAGTFTLIHAYLEPAEAKAALSYTVLSLMFGIGIGIYVGGLLAVHFGWPSIFIVLLVYAIFILLSTFLFTEVNQSKQPILFKQLFHGYARALCSPYLVRYAFALGMVSAVSYVYSTAAPVISAQLLHLSASGYGRWNLLVMLGMLAGSLHGKRLMTRYSVHRVLILGLVGLLIATALFSVFFIPNLQAVWFFFLLALLLYYFGGLAFPCASFLALEHAQDRNSASGMMSFVNMGTAVLGVILLGMLPWSWLINFIGMLVIGLLVVMWVCRRKPCTKAIS